MPGSSQTSAIPASKHERMRHVMLATALVAAALAVALIACLALASYDSSQAAVQQVGGTPVSPDAVAVEDDKTAVGPRRVHVPALGQLLGQSRNGAIAAIGYGAEPIESAAAGDEGPAVVRVTLALTEERSRDFAGAPRAYLGIDAQGRVCEAGYSAATRSLGYRNDLTFAEAIEEAHIIQGVLAAAGVQADESQLRLPSNRAAYSTFRDDGTTLECEHAEFSGTARAGDARLSWQASLSYDYTQAVQSGDLRDTVRIVKVSVSPA